MQKNVDLVDLRFSKKINAKNATILVIVAVHTEENEPLRICVISFHHFNSLRTRRWLNRWPTEMTPNLLRFADSYLQTSWYSYPQDTMHTSQRKTPPGAD